MMRVFCGGSEAPYAVKKMTTSSEIQLESPVQSIIHLTAARPPRRRQARAYRSPDWVPGQSQDSGFDFGYETVRRYHSAWTSISAAHR